MERTVPFGFLTITITILWYQLCGDPQTDLIERRRQAPWYRQKASVSYADMLAALRRELIRAGVSCTSGFDNHTSTNHTTPILISICRCLNRESRVVMDVGETRVGV